MRHPGAETRRGPGDRILLVTAGSRRDSRCSGVANSSLIADLTKEAEVRDVFARIYDGAERYGDAFLTYRRLSPHARFYTTRLLAE